MDKDLIDLQKEPKKLIRRKKLKRSKDNLPPFKFTSRDFEILGALYEYGRLTSVQITELLFSNIKPNGAILKCNRRLKCLYHHNYVNRAERPTLNTGVMNAPLDYALTEFGAMFYTARSGITKNEALSHVKLLLPETDEAAHLRLVHDVEISLLVDARKAGFVVVERKPEAKLRALHKNQITYASIKDKAKQSKLFPDSYFLLRDSKGQEHHIFIEADRGTETVKSNTYEDFGKKIYLYKAFLRSGYFKELYNADKFKVLTVTIGVGVRAENLVELAEKSGDGSEIFYITNLGLMAKENMLTSDIWLQPHKAETVYLFQKG